MKNTNCKLQIVLGSLLFALCALPAAAQVDQVRSGTQLPNACSPTRNPIFYQVGVGWFRATAITNGCEWRPISTSELIDTGLFVPVTRTVNGHALSANVTVTKTDLGLGNVDNTSDANKPVSTAQQSALDLKAPLASPTFTGTVNGVTKAMVGLGNVLNLDQSNPTNITQDGSHRFASDTEKSTWNGKQDALGFTPENVANRRSSFQVTPDDSHYPTEKLVADQLALKQNSLGFTPENIANKNVASGYPGLDSGSKISASQVPTLNQNTTGTAANLSGTPALPNGTTATTQTANDNSTKLATTAYVDGGLSGKQNSLGYTAENTANRRTSFQVTPDDSHYPSEKLVSDQLALKQNSLGFTAENVANKDTDSTLAANSDTKYASQKAIKSYVDTGLGAKQNSLSTGDNLRFNNLGLNVAPPTDGGRISATAGANNVTMFTLKRSTDSSPTGKFLDFQKANGASLFSVDILGNATIPDGSRLNLAGTSNQILFSSDYTTTGTLTWTTSGSSKTITFPNETGTACTTGSVCSGYQGSLGYTAENSANRRTSFQVTPDDSHYPSEKLVSDQLALKQNSLNFTDLPLITPKITTGIKDVNGNSIVAFSPTASAVDGVTVTNAATANPATVTVSATGSDSNINLNLVSKGTGTVKCNGGSCGITNSAGNNVFTKSDSNGNLVATGVTENGNTLDWILDGFAGGSIEVFTVVPNGDYASTQLLGGPKAVLTLNGDASRSVLGDALGNGNGTTLAVDDAAGEITAVGLINANSGLKVFTQLVPNSPGSVSVGDGNAPFQHVFIGTAIGNNIQITGTATAARVATFPDETGIVQLSRVVAFASLPTCNSTNEGMIRGVNNSNTNTWGATLAGGGSNHVLAYCNGTNWTVNAK